VFLFVLVFTLSSSSFWLSCLFLFNVVSAPLHFPFPMASLYFALFSFPTSSVAVFHYFSYIPSRFPLNFCPYIFMFFPAFSFLLTSPHIFFNVLLFVFYQVIPYYSFFFSIFCLCAFLYFSFSPDLFFLLLHLSFYFLSFLIYISVFYFPLHISFSPSSFLSDVCDLVIMHLFLHKCTPHSFSCRRTKVERPQTSDPAKLPPQRFGGLHRDVL
jgi:hypothetical protein